MTSRASAVNLLSSARQGTAEKWVNAGRTEAYGGKFAMPFSIVVNRAEIVNITHMAENINEATNALLGEEINLLHVPAFRKAKA